MGGFDSGVPDLSRPSFVLGACTYRVRCSGKCEVRIRIGVRIWIDVRIQISGPP